MADRGVSTVVSYVLVLGIIAILMSTLITAVGPHVIDQHRSATQSTLEVTGNYLASDIESADRLVTAAEGQGTVSFRTELPDRVGGHRYEIEIEQDGNTTASLITLRTSNLETEVIVPIRTRTPLEERSGAQALDGGTLQITYDEEADKLMINDE